MEGRLDRVLGALLWAVARVAAGPSWAREWLEGSISAGFGIGGERIVKVEQRLLDSSLRWRGRKLVGFGSVVARLTARHLERESWWRRVEVDGLRLERLSFDLYYVVAGLSRMSSFGAGSSV